MIQFVLLLSCLPVRAHHICHVANEQFARTSPPQVLFICSEWLCRMPWKDQSWKRKLERSSWQSSSVASTRPSSRWTTPCQPCTARSGCRSGNACTTNRTGRTRRSASCWRHCPGRARWRAWDWNSGGSRSRCRNSRPLRAYRGPPRGGPGSGRSRPASTGPGRPTSRSSAGTCAYHRRWCGWRSRCPASTRCRRLRTRFGTRPRSARRAHGRPSSAGSPSRSGHPDPWCSRRGRNDDSSPVGWGRLLPGSGYRRRQDRSASGFDNNLQN